MARPREFDESDVLDRSMEVFWRQGYEGTSIEDLVKATGLSRSSLYHTFDSKRGVLEATMAHYLGARLDGMVAVLEADDPGLGGALGFFAQFQFVANEYPDRMALGCLLTNTLAEMAVVDPAVRGTGDSYLGRLRSAFFGALTSAEANGELHAGTAERRSRLLATQAIGLFVMMRGNPDIDDVLSLVQSTMDEIESWRLTP